MNNLFRIRLLPAMMGVVLIAFGVLFLLAAAATSKFWPQALFFLITGALSIGLGLFLNANQPSEHDQEEMWLPIDETTWDLWFIGLLSMPAIVISTVIYLLAGGNWLIGVPALVLALLGPAALILIDRRNVVVFFKEMFLLGGVQEGYLRSLARRICLGRNSLVKMVGGLPSHRRGSWESEVIETQNFVADLLSTIRRISDAGENYDHDSLSEVVGAANKFDQLLRKVTTGATAADVARLMESSSQADASMDQLDLKSESAKRRRKSLDG